MLVGDLGEAADVANRWAPEHLQVAVAQQLERLARDRTRPLLARDDREQVLNDLAAGCDLAGYEDWYQRDHLPDRLGVPGFKRIAVPGNTRASSTTAVMP